jgi:hypothetical protein
MLDHYIPDIFTDEAISGILTRHARERSGSGSLSLAGGDGSRAARGVAAAVACCRRAGKDRRSRVAVARKACDFSRIAGCSKVISRFPFLGKAATRRLVEGSKQGTARKHTNKVRGILTQPRVKFLPFMLRKLEHY